MRKKMNGIVVLAIVLCIIVEVLLLVGVPLEWVLHLLLIVFLLMTVSSYYKIEMEEMENVKDKEKMKLYKTKKIIAVLVVVLEIITLFLLQVGGPLILEMSLLQIVVLLSILKLL